MAGQLHDRHEGPGNAGAFACQRPADVPSTGMSLIRALPAATPLPAPTVRGQLAALEALARSELATLEVRAGLQRQRDAEKGKPTLELPRELQDLAWDLGLDASTLP